MQAVAAKISASLKAKGKSDEHRAAISAAQRRRHASRRVLTAVESAHRDLAAKAAADGGAQLRLRALAGDIGPQKGATLEEVADEYRVQLREFRRSAPCCDLQRRDLIRSEQL